MQAIAMKRCCTSSMLAATYSYRGIAAAATATISQQVRHFSHCRRANLAASAVGPVWIPTESEKLKAKEAYSNGATLKFHNGVDVGKNIGEQKMTDLLSEGYYKSLLFMFTKEEEVFNPKEICEKHGVQFSHIPTDITKLSFAMADRLVDEINRLPRPCLVQCEGAIRAGSAAMMAFLKNNPDMSMEELLEFEKDTEILYYDYPMFPPWVHNYLKAHTLQLVPDVPGGVWFRQLFDINTWTYTYILADPVSREAIIIDPVLEEVPRDVDLINQNGLKLVAAINTHVHADHVTGTGCLKKSFEGFDTILGLDAKPFAVADRYAGHGQKIYFGDRYVEARNTPGHTPACISLVLDNHTKIFTGDALFVNGCGRTDLPGGCAETLYNSINREIFALPEACTIYPAHDYKGNLCSSVGMEKRYNPRTNLGKAGFVEFMNNLKLQLPQKVEEAVRMNMEDGVGAECSNCPPAAA
eukprot:Filipodium_phascolosomae@DN532_c0_g1_i1.p1